MYEKSNKDILEIGNLKKRVLFRTDSSSFIGAGHVVRDLVLASRYKKAKIFFAKQKLEGNINSIITQKNYRLKLLKTSLLYELITLIKKLKIDVLVIDTYKITYEDEKEIKRRTKVKIVCFDDKHIKHYCDILLNHNISANEKEYKKLVPSFCKIKCGNKYTLIREEFYLEKKIKKCKKEKVKNVLLIMGGADPKNLNPKIIKVLQNIKNLKINVVTTTANKKLNELVDICRAKKDISLYINSKEIAKLMNESDLAITTTSSTVHELLFMDVPFIGIKIIPNQNRMYGYLKKNNYMCMEEYCEKKLAKFLERFEYE